MDFKVTRNVDDIRNDDIVVDSDFPNNIQCIRIDHHVDECTTNIDSIYQAFNKQNGNKIDGKRIITSTIDTDSIISAAVIDLLLSGELRGQDKTTLETEIFKIIYSSCFWCDYNVAYWHFSDEINRKGELLDLYLRQELQIHIGLSYREKIIEEEQSQIFTKLIDNVKNIIIKGNLPLHIEKFPKEDVYKELTEVAKKCIIKDAPENNDIGYIKTPDNEHLLPRVYFKLFRQPLIARITLMEDNEISVLIGTNPYSLKEWSKINLKKLAVKLNEKNEKINFSGRRNVIKARFKGDLNILYNILSDLQPDELFDNSELYSIYK